MRCYGTRHNNCLAMMFAFTCVALAAFLPYSGLCEIVINNVEMVFLI